MKRILFFLLFLAQLSTVYAEWPPKGMTEYAQWEKYDRLGRFSGTKIIYQSVDGGLYVYEISQWYRLTPSDKLGYAYMFHTTDLVYYVLSPPPGWEEIGFESLHNQYGQYITRAHIYRYAGRYYAFHFGNYILLEPSEKLGYEYQMDAGGYYYYLFSPPHNWVVVGDLKCYYSQSGYAMGRFDRNTIYKEVLPDGHVILYVMLPGNAYRVDRSRKEGYQYQFTWGDSGTYYFNRSDIVSESK